MKPGALEIGVLYLQARGLSTGQFVGRRAAQIAKERNDAVKWFDQEVRKCPSIGHFSILDLTDDTCHWPEGENSYLFCGRTVQRGSSYCCDHVQRAYRCQPCGND